MRKIELFKCSLLAKQLALLLFEKPLLLVFFSFLFGVIFYIILGLLFILFFLLITLILLAANIPLNFITFAPLASSTTSIVFILLGILFFADIRKKAGSNFVLYAEIIDEMGGYPDKIVYLYSFKDFIIGKLTQDNQNERNEAISQVRVNIKKTLSLFIEDLIFLVGGTSEPNRSEYVKEFSSFMKGLNEFYTEEHFSPGPFWLQLKDAEIISKFHEQRNILEKEFNSYPKQSTHSKIIPFIKRVTSNFTLLLTGVSTVGLLIIFALPELLSVILIRFGFQILNDTSLGITLGKEVFGLLAVSFVLFMGYYIARVIDPESPHVKQIHTTLALFEKFKQVLFP